MLVITPSQWLYLQTLAMTEGVSDLFNDVDVYRSQADLTMCYLISIVGVVEGAMVTSNIDCKPCIVPFTRAGMMLRYSQLSRKVTVFFMSPLLSDNLALSTVARSAFRRFSFWRISPITLLLQQIFLRPFGRFLLASLTFPV